MSEPAPPGPAPTNGAHSPTPTPAPEDRSNWIHPNQYAHAVKKRDEYKGTAATLQEQLAQATNRLGALDTVSATVKTLEEDLTKERQKFGLFRDVTGAGITDPEIVDEVAKRYQALPKDKRPKLGDMLTEWRKALTSEDGDPSVVPKLLRPHLAATWKAGPATVEPSTPRAGHNPSTTTPPGSPAGDPSRIYDLTRQLMSGKITREEHAKQVAAVRAAAGGVQR